MARFRTTALAFAAMVACGPGMAPGLSAQTVVSTSSAPVRASGELAQLAAPVALYPDALLAQVLMAATYPLDIVQAARWLRGQSGTPDDVAEAAADKPWDPSVKSLLAFPSVLSMMDEEIDWTRRLGDAVAEDRQALMDEVQALRARAQAAGHLRSRSEQVVVADPGSAGTTVIRIESARPDIVYVPRYDPLVVYGAWPYPAYPPFSLGAVVYPSAGHVAIGFGVGIVAGYALWSAFDWHRHRIHVVHVPRYRHFSHGRPPPVAWAPGPGARPWHGRPDRHHGGYPRAGAYPGPYTGPHAGPGPGHGPGQGAWQGSRPGGGAGQAGPGRREGWAVSSGAGDRVDRAAGERRGGPGEARHAREAGESREARGQGPAMGGPGRQGGERGGGASGRRDGEPRGAGMSRQVGEWRGQGPQAGGGARERRESGGAGGRGERGERGGGPRGGQGQPRTEGGPRLR